MHRRQPQAPAVASRLRRVLSLSGREWAMAAEAFVLAPYVELGLRVIPLDRLLATLGCDLRVGGRRREPDPERMARIVEALFRLYPLRPSCLKKSLVLLRLARRRGWPAELRVGVRKDGAELLAHAWIECAGRTLLPGDGVERYYPLPRITAAALATARSAGYPFVTEDNI